MGLHTVVRLSIALALLDSFSTVLSQVQIMYTDNNPIFVGNGEQAQAYVVGFGKEEGQQPPSEPHRTMLMRSVNGTSYRCYIPDEPAAAADASEDGSSTSVSKVGEGSLLPKKTPSELLEALAEHCYYRIEEWWTYELCYKKKLRQYHKEGGKVASQYVLGLYKQQQAQEDEVQVDASEVSGALRYVVQRYADGEECELTGKPRQAEVRFTCGSGEDTLLTGIKELASCRYVATVSTPRLCKHPAFQQHPAPAALIQCHPLSEEQASEAAAASRSGHCSSGAAQQPDGTCAAGSMAALPGGQGSSETAARDDAAPSTAVVRENITQPIAEEDGEEHSLLQSVLEGQEEEPYYQYNEVQDPNDDQDPYALNDE